MIKNKPMIVCSLGQRIPPGLHVRLNLETGLREAKLLDDSEKSSSNEIISVSPGS